MPTSSNMQLSKLPVLALKPGFSTSPAQRDAKPSILQPGPRPGMGAQAPEGSCATRMVLPSTRKPWLQQEQSTECSCCAGRQCQCQKQPSVDTYGLFTQTLWVLHPALHERLPVFGSLLCTANCPRLLSLLLSAGL